MCSAPLKMEATVTIHFCEAYFLAYYYMLIRSHIFCTCTFYSCFYEYKSTIMDLQWVIYRLVLLNHARLYQFLSILYLSVNGTQYSDPLSGCSKCNHCIYFLLCCIISHSCSNITVYVANSCMIIQNIQ